MPFYHGLPDIVQESFMSYICLRCWLPSENGVIQMLKYLKMVPGFTPYLFVHI